jgi:hypothetical protein
MTPGCDPDQFQGWPDILLIPNPKTNPAGMRENMMRYGASLVDQLVTLLPADKAIEKTVPMNVTGLLALNGEPDPAESMHASPHTRPTRYFSFDRADRAKPPGIKQAGRAQKQRVE